MARGTIRWIGAGSLLAAIALAVVLLLGESAPAPPARSLSAQAATSPALAEPARAIPQVPAATITTTPFVAPASESLAPQVPDFDDASLSGVVLDPEGSPVQGAMVAVFRQPISDAARNAAHHTISGPEGRFAFRFYGESPSTLLLVAFRDGDRPGTTGLTHSPGSRTRGITVRLRSAAAIEGFLTGSGKPIPNESVSVDAAYGVPGLFGCGPELWWDEGGQDVEIKHGAARSDAEGRYRVTGLSPITYGVQVFAAGRFGDAHPDVAEFKRIPVAAAIPPARQDFEFTLTGLVVSAFEGSRPVGGILSLTSSRTGHEWRQSVFRGVRVEPDVSYRLRFYNPEFQSREMEIEPLRTGETRKVSVAVERAQHAGLSLRLTGVAAAEVNRLRVRLLPCDDLIESADPLRDSARAAMMALKGADGVFSIPAVPFPPGRYRLIAANAETTGSWMLPSESASFELPKSGLAAVTVNAEQGGRFELILTNPENALIDGSWELRDAPGEIALSGRVSAPHLDGDETLLTISTGGFAVGSGSGSGGGFRKGIPLGGSISFRRSVNGSKLTQISDPSREWRQGSKLLIPGSYRLLVKQPGYEDSTSDVNIAAGIINVGEVALRRGTPSSR